MILIDYEGFKVSNRLSTVNLLRTGYYQVEMSAHCKENFVTQD